MPIFNYKAKEMIVKIVYYGPGLCGKTTSLQHLHQHIIPERRGEIYFLATEADQTIYFELLPLHVGEIKNFKLRFQVYTVPGQVKYNNTRKAVLQRVDAVVFVADSQKSRQRANVISFKNLHHNLKSGYNILLKDIPMVYEYNKRDMSALLTIEELNHDLNPWRLPYFETIALKGAGVLDTFEAISSLTIQNLEKRFRQPSSSSWRKESRETIQVYQFLKRDEAPESKPTEEFQEQEEPIFPENEPSILMEEDEPIFPEERGPVFPEERETPTDIFHTILDISDGPIFPKSELSYSDVMALTYDDSDLIFEEGDPGNEMYFIEEGQVKIIGSYRHTRKVVITYSEGDFFGEMALFGGETRSARAVAIGKTRLLAITKETLSTQIANKPEILVALLTTLSGRIRYNTKTISKLADQNKELVQHLKKARNAIQQFKKQNESLRQKLDKSQK